MANGILNDGTNAGPHRRRRYNPDADGPEAAQMERQSLSGSAGGDDPDGGVVGSQIGSDDVPAPEADSNIEELLSWIESAPTDEGQQARAQGVLDRERISHPGGPRPTLVADLEDRLTAPSSDPA